MRFKLLFMALLVVLLTVFPSLSEAGEVAVVEIARVIDGSAPGKAGQRYVDKLKADMEDELERYKKSVAKDKDAAEKTARKQAELTSRYRAEYARVTDLVTTELRKVIAQWLETNKKGVTVILPAHETLGFAKGVDISNEIMVRLNAVTIDFTKK